MEPITSALPVTLELAGEHADGVRHWTEGVLGWQAVDGDTSGLVPPALEICDVAAVADLGVSHVPRLLVIDDAEAPAVVAMAAARLAPEAAVAWPSGRDQLAELAARVVTRPRSSVTVARRLRLGGSAGGVGTSTVALGLAGLAAWSGSRTLAAVRGTGLTFRQLPAAALSGPDIWARADPLPGLADARSVRVTDGRRVPELTDPRIDVFVDDAGVDADIDLLVCRRDAAGLSALAMTTAAVVVVVGGGPVSMERLRRAADGRRTLALPWSARVARAGLTGRIPADLPGTWLRLLRPLVPSKPAGNPTVPDGFPQSGRIRTGSHSDAS